MAEYWTDYQWLVIVGALVSFAMAWGIGANDVANSFGTSVGSKAITLWQACIIAAVFEFAGAVGLGGEVTKTIAGSIARPTAFYAQPELFAYGMVCALAAAAAWVYVATYLSLAVSTSHAAIGGVIGFALVWKGKDAVVWNDHKDEFPFSDGLVPVVCSWFVSPIMAGIVSAALFFINRLVVLRRENSSSKAMWMFPVLVVVTVYINVFFVLYKGASAELKWAANQCAWVAALIAIGCGLLGVFPGMFLMKRKLKKDLDIQNTAEEDDKAADQSSTAQTDVESQQKSGIAGWLQRAKALALHGVTQDIHADVHKDATVAAMHGAAEVFDPRTEQVYKYLQVFSACCVSFAHGANDVANAVGPFAAIYYVYRNWQVSPSAETPKWILAMGGAGIVIGLATYGYNIMRTLGIGMAKMTPSRGFCAELATSFTVALASVYGLPISTTQTIVGAEVGVGLLENVRTGANWMLFGKQVLAWVFTLVVAGFVSAALFAQGVFAPSITMSKDITRYENALRAAVEDTYKELNSTNFQVKMDVNRFDAPLNSTIASKVKSTESLFNFTNKGYIPPQTLIQLLNDSLAAYKNYSTVTVSYNKAAQSKTSASITVPEL